ncbi:hypothetical protein [Streptomyces catenulae]|uniref:Uncharacterized protein n=1 Tax=Streptomyces catenulae TaxID=66875 RepID=A0ABV2Z6S5_9ACTN|nr:hypothetical protein [Streptomyces catenulae]
MRDRKLWIGAFVTVLTGFVALVFQGGWEWVQGKLSDPPGLTAYSSGLIGCNPRYLDAPLAELHKQIKTIDHRGVHIPTADDWPSLPVTLQTSTPQAIVVTGVKVSVLSTRPLPEHGSVVDAECGGGMDERPFDVDLTADPVSVKPSVERTGQGKVIQGHDFPFKVASGDPEQFTFNIRNVAQDARFAITFSWVSDGEPGSTRLDNDGHGYRVMNLPKNLPRYSKGEVGRGKPAS